MYQVGEKIVYGSMGVCTITDIGLPDIAGATRQCYVLKPHYVANSRVYAPIEDNPVKMRRLLTAKEAQDLIDSLPQVRVFTPTKEKQELYNTCRSAIRSADSLLLAKLLKTLYQKKLAILEQRKIVPSAEKEYFDTAERMFFGELAEVLDIPMDEVKDTITDHLEPASRTGGLKTAAV